MFSEYYVRKIKEYEGEQEKDEAKSIKKMVKTIKDMSILLRITKKICAKSNMKDQIEKDCITIAARPSRPRRLGRVKRGCSAPAQRFHAPTPGTVRMLV